MLALVAAMAVNAKTVETTLWEGTYSDGVELNAETVATFKAGDILRVYVTVPAGGANFKIVYKGAPDWSETTIPSINDQWPWVNGGETYKDFTLTDADITALSGKNVYIYKGENSTIKKIMLIRVLVPTGEQELLDANWTASWDAKTFAAQSGAKIGDVIRIQYTAYKDDDTDWPWVQFHLMDGSGNNLVDAVAASKQKNSVTVFDYEIETIDVLTKIQTGGFSIKGDQFTLNSVKLLTYADSYDAVSVTIGKDGIATFSSAKHLDFSGTGITPYYASQVAKGSVKLTAATTTWSWQGYILKGSAGTYTVPVTAQENASYPDPNYLKQQVGEGTVTKSTSDTFHYIFAKDKDGYIGFYKLTDDHTLGAKKAYLETTEDIAPASAAARVALVFDDDTTTGVESVVMPSQPAASGYYDLQGRQVKTPTKGLYIVNGKKVMVK